MRLLNAIATALAVGASSLPAFAHHVDPYDVIDRAFSAYKEREDYKDVRAIFSEALRDAPHDGVLDPEFALVYALYADSARFDGNPSFALLLAEEGLALTASVPEPDVELHNTLTISRAYALAELGRYEEAARDATIAALWLEERFGTKARTDLEAEIEDWKSRSNGDALPSVAELAIDLLQKAEQAMIVGDTGTAISLASRATLPEGSGLSSGAVRLVNAWVKSVIGSAYAVEGRHLAAAHALLDAVELLSARPWDGLEMIVLHPDIDTELTGRIVSDVFTRLASSAVFTGEIGLADAALRNAKPYATTPEARQSLLLQRANVLLQSDDDAAVEAVFRESEAEARAAGNEESAALAHFYASVMQLRRNRHDEAATYLDEMLQAARDAAEAAGKKLAQVEYILTTATRVATNATRSYEKTLLISHEAYAAFLKRQGTMASYEAGQEAARRERRRFLETHLELLYDTSR